MNEEAIRNYRQRMEDIIERCGFMVQSVFPTADDPEGLPYSYTIGLHDQGLPELVVIGLPGDVGLTLLNDVAAYLKEKRKSGGDSTGEFTSPAWPVSFHIIDAATAAAEEFATGARRRSTGAAKYLQVIWPDKNGQFPWNANASDSYKQSQVVLHQTIGQ